MEFINNNEKQIKFADIRGVISELNGDGDFCSVTLSVGHEKLRDVNIATRRPEMDRILEKHKIGDKVLCRYYPSSKRKHDRWYTHLILLSIDLD